MKKLAAALATLLLAVTTGATRAEAEEDGQIWLAPIVQTPVVGKVRSWIEMQARWKDEGAQLDRLIFRPALNVAVGSGFTLWAGYGYMPFTRPTTGTKLYPEHRPWQQVMHVFGDPKTGQLTNRLRFEQRLIDGVDEASLRLRYMARVVYRPKAWHGFGFAVWDEMFVNLNSPNKGPRAGFDQNRLAFGLQYSPFKQLVLEPSYVAISQWRPNREVLLAHTALLFVWITL